MTKQGGPEKRIGSLGPKTSQWLRAAGIESPGQLKRLGAIEAFFRLQETVPELVTLNALWAIEAEITGIDWRDLTERRKAELRAAVEGC